MRPISNSYRLVSAHTVDRLYPELVTTQTTVYAMFRSIPKESEKYQVTQKNSQATCFLTSEVIERCFVSLCNWKACLSFEMLHGH